SLLSIAFLIVSFGLVSFSMKSIPIGTAYAVFTGLGAAGTAVIGMFFLSEGVSFWSLVSLFVLLAWFFGLILVDGNEAEKEAK
ncbi:DMT family transporter, partial [Listeria monocytogenes]|uniref:DMT family transporter n=1 Tax=Listeria monocytogenes TaxID=1639 RepID=UPI000E6C171E